MQATQYVIVVSSTNNVFTNSKFVPDFRLVDVVFYQLRGGRNGPQKDRG